MDTNLFFDAMLDNFSEWHGLTTLLDTKRRQPYVERVGPDHKALVRRFLVTLTAALPSASAYLESREAQLADQFGQKSEKAESFRSHKSTEFDTHFSYRLCAKLRNFFVHAPPLDAFTLTQLANNHGGVTWRLLADSGKLLAHKDRFNAQLRTDLERHRGPIDLDALMKDYESCLIRIEESAIGLHAASLAGAHYRVNRVISEISPPSVTTPYAILSISPTSASAASTTLSPAFSLNSLGSIECHLTQPIRLKQRPPLQPIAVNALASEEGLDVIEACLIFDSDALTGAVNGCLKDSQTAGDSLVSIATTAATCLMQLKLVTGAPPLEQLILYRDTVRATQEARNSPE